MNRNGLQGHFGHMLERDGDQAPDNDSQRKRPTVESMTLEQMGFLVAVVTLIATVVLGLLALLVGVLALIVPVVMSLLQDRSAPRPPQQEAPGGTPAPKEPVTASG